MLITRICQQELRFIKCSMITSAKHGAKLFYRTKLSMQSDRPAGWPVDPFETLISPKYAFCYHAILTEA